MTHLEPDESIQADARRWQYVRDNLAQSHSVKMDGQHSWRFRSLFGATGPTIDEAVDNAIERSAISAEELFRHFRGKDTDEEK